ncbi:MAG: hypothetical protein JNL66_23150 [Alphaproteobacteria bacterium]|nr:hypothetical protein [Alphaproteobacteria bacterium]
MIARRSLAAACAAFALGLAGPAAAQAPGVAGSYDVQGQLGSQSYRGTVTVTRAMDVYTVAWQIEGQSYRGVAMLNENALSIAYLDPTMQPGVVVLRRNGRGWSGTWAVMDTTRNGIESWTPRAAAATPPAPARPAAPPAK